MGRMAAIVTSMRSLSLLGIDRRLGREGLGERGYEGGDGGLVPYGDAQPVVAQAGEGVAAPDRVATPAQRLPYAQAVRHVDAQERRARLGYDPQAEAGQRGREAGAVRHEAALT